MKHVKLFFSILFLSFVFIFQAVADSVCPDSKAVIAIEKELDVILKQAVCNHDFRPSQISWLKNKVLPNIMHKGFLGVEPPQNWQLLTDSFMQECYHGENICLADEQDKLAQCFMDSTPIIMLLFSSWYYQNCDIINEAVLKNWDNKKELIIQLIAKQPH